MSIAGATAAAFTGKPNVPRHAASAAFAAAIALLVALPVLTVLILAVAGRENPWPHLAVNVIPQAVSTTVMLAAMVAVLTASMGVVAASFVVRCDFPGRAVLSWALILPIAVPPYVAAYVFAEFFLFTGPVQTGLRALFGWQSARDYWFPDIRSTGGAAFVLSMVLYPYVYLSTRVVFLMQGRLLADAARTLGASALGAYWRVLLPVSRPAIVAGLVLVLMETLNDIGAVEYLGVRTLTQSVYSTWLSRGSLEGAAQIACVLLLFVIVLVLAERWARRHQRFHMLRTAQLRAAPPRITLHGWRAALAFSACAAPVVFGFGIPLAVLGGYVARRSAQFTDPALHAAAFNSALVAAATAAITVCLALVLLKATRLARGRAVAMLTRVATFGYALPGTILGIGLLFALAAFDNALDGALRLLLGFSSGLLLSGSAAAVVYACSARFVALAEANIQAGIDKLPRHLEDAAASLGTPASLAFRTVILPMLKPAIATASLLVFVDTVKELSATILLRPIGFSTLATQVYENASRGAVEDSAAAALLIVAVSLAPVLILSHMLRRDEPT